MGRLVPPHRLVGLRAQEDVHGADGGEHHLLPAGPAGHGRHHRGHDGRQAQPDRLALVPGLHGLPPRSGSGEAKPAAGEAGTVGSGSVGHAIGVSSRPTARERRFSQKATPNVTFRKNRTWRRLPARRLQAP